MPFKKGHPRFGGRKANALVQDARDLARQYTSEAVEALVAVMRDDDKKAKVTAALGLLARGWGLPAQTITATVDTIVRASGASTLESKLDAVLAIRSGEEAPRPTVQ